MGVSALRLSLPYHDVRMPPELTRADYIVSANVGRTAQVNRQAVLDAWIHPKVKDVVKRRNIDDDPARMVEGMQAIESRNELIVELVVALAASEGKAGARAAAEEAVRSEEASPSFHKV